MYTRLLLLLQLQQRRLLRQHCQPYQHKAHLSSKIHSKNLKYQFSTMISSTFMFRVELGMTIETHWNCWGLLAKEESRRALEESRLAKEESERVKARRLSWGIFSFKAHTSMAGCAWLSVNMLVVRIGWSRDLHFRTQYAGPYFSSICKVKNGENGWICPSIPFFSCFQRLWTIPNLDHFSPKSSQFPLKPCGFKLRFGGWIWPQEQIRVWSQQHWEAKGFTGGGFHDPGNPERSWVLPQLQEPFIWNIFHETFWGKLWTKGNTKEFAEKSRNCTFFSQRWCT